MSMYPAPIFDVPELTAEVAQAAFPKGNRYLKMRDELGTIYNDKQFADLYPAVGQPAEAPWRLALVTIVQFAEDLTDREAAEAVRSRIDLKYLLGLGLRDPGFNFSVLSEFRDRLLASGAEERLLNVMLQLFQKRKWLKAKGKQRSDATHVVSAVRRLNRLELVGETLHHTLNVLAQIDPNWLKNQITPEWFDRYGSRFTDYRLPKEKEKRFVLAQVIGDDGHYLLRQIYSEKAPAYLSAIPAVDVLRQVWLQNYYIEGETIEWRDQKKMPPAAVLIRSPYDVEVRYSRKRNTEWNGYKIHLTEACDQDMPKLITHVQTTLATDQDITVVDELHQSLKEKNLLPQDHLLDAAYLSGETLVNSQNDFQVNLIGPVREDQSWQALDENAFDSSRFAIDWEAQSVTCPSGKQSRFWKSAEGRRGKRTIQVQFDKSDCVACADRVRCTRGKKKEGRQLTLQPQAQYLAVQAARKNQKTAAFQKEYALRSGVEGAISQVVFALGMRRTRYRGLDKTHLQGVATAAAANLIRIINWLWEIPCSQTPKSRFAQLASAF